MQTRSSGTTSLSRDLRDLGCATSFRTSVLSAIATDVLRVIRRGSENGGRRHLLQVSDEPNRGGGVRQNLGPDPEWQKRRVRLQWGEFHQPRWLVQGIDA